MSKKNNDKKQAGDFVLEAFEQASKLPEVNREQVRIWGGIVADSQLTSFLKEWEQIKFPFQWAIVEEVSRFYALSLTNPLTALPDHLFALERLRLFGKAGDLDLRRDGKQFRWRYVGDVQPTVPAFDAKTASNFWAQADAGLTFSLLERDYYQWNRNALEQRVRHQWAEDVTPTPDYLQQYHYLENGRVAFVRYVQFHTGGLTTNENAGGMADQTAYTGETS